MWRCYLPILVLGVLVRTSYQQKGLQIAPCIWEWTNGSVLNLNGVGFDNGTARWHSMGTITPETDPNTYSVNPCYGFTFSTLCEDVSACRLTPLGGQLNIGDSSSSNMYYSEEHSTVVLEYSHNFNNSEKTISRILTGCNMDPEDQLVVYGVRDSTTRVLAHEFLLLSECACPDVCANHTAPTLSVPTTGPITHTPVTIATAKPSGGSKHMTAGGIICVLFVCGVCAYFLFGSAYMYCFRGATGIEIIPNVHFWMGLPNLIFDGLTFICTCGSKTQVITTSPPSSDYDKI